MSVFREHYRRLPGHKISFHPASSQQAVRVSVSPSRQQAMSKLFSPLFRRARFHGLVNIPSPVSPRLALTRKPHAAARSWPTNKNAMSSGSGQFILEKRASFHPTREAPPPSVWIEVHVKFIPSLIFLYLVEWLAAFLGSFRPLGNGGRWHTCLVRHQTNNTGNRQAHNHN